MAMTRLPFSAAVAGASSGGAPAPVPRLALRPWAPAFSVGETGAAAAWLSLAMTVFFLREGVFEGPVLTWLLSDGESRAAVVLGPGDAKEAQRG